ncbi:hypothetical protein NDU88_000611 [Pleurodeles waltl]|uniref:Receptor ligand binding region domain-containing protein n=1 Tax=Pleurodeles waltl TaxID=8319 RepID=A0AAV7KN90_PLEWA|nr:hypothetical protein NDU88_000611 [Pleurodeles waltl]
MILQRVSDVMILQRNYQWLQAMVFAIEEINRNPNLLPNITLGFLIYDSCADPQRALHGTLWMLTGQERHTVNYRCYSGGPLAGIVGDGGSKGSIPIARVLGLYRYPQISYFSTTPLLSDRNQFPSFFRTIPSDIFQFHGLAQLVIHFNWTWVGILAADDDYGQTGVQILKVDLHNAGVCIAFSENIILSDSDRNAYHIVQVIKNSTANAIVIFALDSHLVPILNEILRQNITGRIFIASEAWSTSPLLSVEKYLKILSGTIGFAIHSKDMPGFKEYFSSVHPLRFSNDLLLQEFWEAAFGCKWQGPEIPTGCCNITTNLCTGAEKLDTVDGFYNDVTSPRVSFNAYRAVYAISVALHVLNSCSLREGPFNQGTCANILDFHCWQLLPYVQNVHFWDDFERKAFFDTSGNPLAQYDIVNWQLQTDGTVMHRTVGRYDLSAPGGNRLLINTTAIRWAASAEGHMGRDGKCFFGESQHIVTVARLNLVKTILE